MSDEPSGKSDWAPGFLLRLCAIGWLCAILYETLDFLKPVRQLCLLFGFWACVIALVNALVLFLIRRQGVFLLFLIVTIPPTVHFGLVVKNIAMQKKMASSPASETPADSNVQEPPSAEKASP